MSRLRQPAGARTSGVAVGGRWTSKTAPAVNETDIGFNDETNIGSPHEWDKRTVDCLGARTVFTRSVTTDVDGNEVVSVTTNTEDPAMFLLARKGDVDYWSQNRWAKHRKDRQIWTAEITRQMLEQGLVATRQILGDDGTRTAMTAASTPTDGEWQDGPHTLTGTVAQIRGLRLIQSTAPKQSHGSKLGGHDINTRVDAMLRDRFAEAAFLYGSLPRPPWEPDGVAWGPQTVAGHATDRYGNEVFVGENGDLLWRALTETDYYGRSPLKQALVNGDLTTDWFKMDFGAETAMIVDAAVYDKTAETQLTTNLFNGVPPRKQGPLRNQMMQICFAQLNRTSWTLEQRDRIRGFVDTLEALKPS